MERKIKWGIIGPGRIAHKFVSDLIRVEDAEVTGVASRSLRKAKQFADEFNIEHAFGNYEELFAFDEVDILYVATPHNFHKDLAIKAMEARKHVLCEKPLGINRKEVLELTESAKENKVFLMEGLWSRFNPSIEKAKALIDNGEIGDVSYLQADFAFYALDRDEESRLLNPHLASGSLLDIGIYPIFLAYLLLGMPQKIQATSKFHPNGTEIQTSMIFEYDTAQAMLYSGFMGNSRMEAEISGTVGEVFIQPRWHAANSCSVVKNGTTEVFELPIEGNGFVYEILEVHNCLKNNKLQSSLWSHQNSLDLAELLDSVRDRCGIHFPFET
ncbi:Gfo/Idh/MocA family protein [Flagellimonas nanhaiensis]|uniref:Gfo/Idh/MocA family oxidoreductase n=1 Tax=Flagellimonas nanhaiensis TaxID=2292706 RepID=A0A371JVA7_9FLAO|nr:Gfo/Idh/MocA family oxidoreductase [Allomuricauda nanhaiensis]RDY61737.1 gfo/Idh/MocA family oxidoreductase [Allomuricauda nanhaiensis]